MKLCTICGVVTSHPGSRCTAHARQSNRSRHNPFYSTREWQHLSTRVIAAHVGEFGWVCPGDDPDHRAHPSRSLTVDHIVTLSAGGAPLDRANLRVLCRSRNSELGARTGNALRQGGGGVAPVADRVAADRARRLCAHGRLLRFFPGRQGDVRTGAPQGAHVAR
jgi:5-methylcytosine-specific restriction endonuclease McrA